MSDQQRSTPARRQSTAKSDESRSAASAPTSTDAGSADAQPSSADTTTTTADAKSSSTDTASAPSADAGRAKGRKSKRGSGGKKKGAGGSARSTTWTGDTQLPNGGLVLADTDGAVIQYAPAKLTASLRYLVARLQRQTEAELPRTIAFTSTLSGEGVSVMARSFGAVLGLDTGRRVCLVDLNWWTFNRRTYRRSEEVHGLYEVLWMDKPLDAVLVPTQSSQLTYLPAGAAPRSVRPTLAQHPRLGDVLEELAGRFDHLVFDLPAVMSTSDAIALRQFSDQVVLVVRQGVASRGQIRSALDDLGDPAPVAAILNQTRTAIPKWVRKLFGLRVA